MKLHLGALGALTLTLALAGCQQATSSTSSAFGDTKALTVTATSTSTKIYWSLKTGAEVTDAAAIASNAWDVAFSSATQGIWTNSGDTASAAVSGGVGGVYYTGTTNFGDVTSFSTSLFGGSLNTDATYYVETMGQSGYGAATTQVLNVMTALVYVSGSGTVSDPYKNDASDSAYAGNAYYSSVGTSAGAPTISASQEVYVIRSGDGAKYFKFQVTDMTGSSSSRIRTIKYAVSN